MTWSRSWPPTRPARTRWRPATRGVLAGVLRAFDPAETDSRLLVTSRFTFTLDGLQDRLEDVQLRPLSEVAQRKLQRRQQALTPPQRLAERAGLAGRAVAVSRGNPGLQDLIGLKLVYGEHVGLERAEAAVAGMEAYLRQGGLPADAEVREFLENLALDTLLAEAGPSNLALLRAATLFDVPVPEPVIGVLAERWAGRWPGCGAWGWWTPTETSTTRPAPPWPPTPWPPGGSSRSAPARKRRWPPPAPGRCLRPGAGRHHRTAGTWWPTGS